MKNSRNKNRAPNSQHANTGYDPVNRDFPRTEEDLDSVSKSEQEELEKRKERTAKASTKPNKKRMS